MGLGLGMCGIGKFSVNFPFKNNRIFIRFIYIYRIDLEGILGKI